MWCGCDWVWWDSKHRTNCVRSEEECDDYLISADQRLIITFLTLLSVSLVSTSRGQEEDNGAPDQWDSVSQADVSSPDNNVSSLQHHATFNTRDSTLIASFIVCPPYTRVENTGGRRENFVKPFLLTCYFSREVLSCFLWLVLKIDVIAITRSLSFVQNIFRET